MMKASTESVTGPHVVSQYVESLVKSKFTHIEIQDFEYIIHNAPNSHYQTPLSQIHFLCFLISILDVKNVLEIGTYKGFTTQCFAAAVGGRGRVATIDHNVTNIRIATELWKKNSIHNIDSHTGLAIEQMNNLVQDKKLFDLIYIDADKDSYNHYFNLALQLAHPGTLIALDNMLWSGAVAEVPIENPRAQILHSLNQSIFSSNYQCTFIPGWDGLILLRVQ